MPVGKGLKNKFIQIFAAGDHTASNGEKVSITSEDLETIATNYNEVLKTGTFGERAPAIKGHSHDSASPAEGWLSAVKVVGDKLFGKFSNINKEFEKQIEDRQYYNRSISIGKDFNIRHVAFLGAVPPAVKGMDDFSDSEAVLSFADGLEKSEALEFTSYFQNWGIENRFKTIGNMMRNIKNNLIEINGIDSANQIISETDINNLQQIDEWEKEEREPVEDNYSEVPMTKEELKEFNQMKTDLATATTRAETAEGKLTAIETEQAEFKAAAEKKEKDDAKTEFNAHADNLVKAGKLTPAVANAQKAEFAASVDNGVLEFGEGDEKTSMLDSKLQTLAALSGVKVVEFSEIATKLDAEPQNFSQEDRDIALLKELD